MDYKNLVLEELTRQENILLFLMEAKEKKLINYRTDSGFIREINTIKGMIKIAQILSVDTQEFEWINEY